MDGISVATSVTYVQLRSFLEEVGCVVMKVQVSSGSSADSLSLVILYKGRGKKNEGAAEL